MRNLGLKAIQPTPVDNVVEFSDGIVEASRDWPLVPDGEYRARYVTYECAELACFKNAARVFVHLQIIDMGEEYGKTLYRAYPVRKFIAGQRVGPVIKNARFIV